MKQYVKKSSKWIIALLLFIPTVVINAQPSGDKPQGPPPVPNDKQVKNIVADLSKELKLDDAQNLQISELYFNHFDQVRELTSTERNDFHSMEDMKSEFENEVLELLSEEQETLFKSYMKKNKPKRGHKPQR